MASSTDNSNNYFNSVSKDLSSNEENPSRLSESTEGLRNTLMSRNLYTEFTEYPIEPNSRQKIVNSVSSIVDTILPFKSLDINNSIVGRLATEPNTPLAEIGTVMLGKQFALNFQSNAIQETVPTINVRNVFDGNSDTKLFQKKIRYNITRKSEGGSLEGFIEDFFGAYPKRNNPFNSSTSNSDYLKNTGVGQLGYLFGNAANDDTGGLNKNIYKPSTREYQEAANDSNNKIADRINIVSNRNWFNFNDNKFYQYNTLRPNELSISLANRNMRQAFEIVRIDSENKDQEYAPSLDFVEGNFGKTNLNGNINYIDNLNPNENPEFNNQWINKETGLNDDIGEQIVWGRDGAEDIVHENLKTFRGVDVTPRGLSNKFNVKSGLLEYTRNLLNASEGKLVDQTRKVYTDNDGKLVGMQGSSLWKSPTGREGLRQHSILDQYDKFAKAIRFDGNEIYGGNPNSVTNKSVLPKIHPILNEDNEIENQNLMFSIENLAVRAIKGDKGVSIIDDDFGTQIPTSEVGYFGGRMMWFPPYGIELTEVSQANYDSTVMIGRSEPMYSYMHSERSATLSFTLLMDYPEQLREFIKTGDHKSISEFFAFGSEGGGNRNNVKNPSRKEQENKETEKEIAGLKKTQSPDIDLPDPISISFPNSVPDENEVGFSIIDKMYNEYSYEVDTRVESVDGSSFALNDDFYFKTGITFNQTTGEYEINVPNGFTQSGMRFIGSGRVLDDNIFRVFNDEENVRFYKIRITGSATTLYKGDSNPKSEEAREFNKELSRRRVLSTESFIRERIKKVTGKDAETLGVVFERFFLGSEESEEKNGTPDAKSSRAAKQERSARVEMLPTDTPPEDNAVELQPSDQEAINTLDRENQTLQSSENNYRRNSRYDNLMEERKAGEVLEDGTSIGDDGILKGFQSVTKNQFYPVFHSQTPEDFHKRLTFLQQCTRQGSAIRNNPEVDENGIRRVRNSAFGRQPICVLRIADFFYTKVIIENVTIDYTDAPLDTNPENFGMQYMRASVTLQMKVIGGQSLKGPIDALQNAVSFNYYANSTFKNDFGPYEAASNAADKQKSYNDRLVTSKNNEFKERFRETNPNNFRKVFESE